MFISTPLDKSLPSYPRRYYEQIIASINTAILRGDLKEGDKLPSERELADLFETSRVPVREAIKVLEFCGIVEQVAGGGMTVKNIELSSLLQKLYFVIATTDDTLRELFESQPRRDIPVFFGYPDKVNQKHLVITRPKGSKDPAP